ncbi:MAG TPA: ATP-binding protein, partial [Acidobacteriota bacterium]|nr:ATP-binding protein [Acidobacteriota bacterium]
IKSNDKVIGVLGVESTDPDRKFSDHDVKLLEGFTELASIAIDNELAHKRLEEQEELFRVILENIPAMVGIVEPNLQLKWVNRQFEQNLGWTLLEAQQSFFKEAFADPESRKEAIQFLQQADAKWRDFEIHLRDGRVSQVACASVRLSDGNLIVIGQDVTERLVAEKNRRQMEEQLRQIQKIEAIGRLAGGVAHDFNNLLMVITGYSELLMMQTAESDHRHKMLSEIYRAAEQGADLTRQLLAFSRKQVLEPKILDLNEVIREIGNMVGRLIGEDIQLVTRLHAKRSRITADQNQLHQVIMNLAVNARDAMPTGGTLMLETSSIEFRGPGESLAVSPPAGFYVQLLVRDSGEGMDELTQARIFEPFFTTKEKGKGTGLGLATVYGIIKQSKGYIYVHSKPGEGTTFQILFPAIGEKEELAESVVSPSGTGAGTETILLVDDNEPARSAVAALLEMKGYRVIQAGDPREALAVTQTLSTFPDLLVTDVVMPYGSGRELAATLSQKYPALKILYLSGYTEEAVSHDGVLDEGTTFLSKPVAMDVLLRKIRELLDR